MTGRSISKERQGGESPSIKWWNIILSTTINNYYNNHVYMFIPYFEGSSKGRQSTEKHLEVSLGALFLLDAAKKADKAFRVSPPGGKDRQACRDIKTMSNHLLEKLVATNLENRSSPEFINPDDTGLDKLTSTWFLHQNHKTKSLSRVTISTMKLRMFPN